jgi:hypothetical protein
MTHDDAMTDLYDDTRPLPFRPGDWVATCGDHQRIARVKDVSRSGGDVLLDLVLYGRDGRRIGRESPALGGPRGHEPACDASGWERIATPEFPVALVWRTLEDGRQVAGFRAADTLPPANWTPRQSRKRPATRPDGDPRLREALRAIADGHNDPRRLAAEALAACRA